MHGAAAASAAIEGPWAHCSSETSRSRPAAWRSASETRQASRAAASAAASRARASCCERSCRRGPGGGGGGGVSCSWLHQADAQACIWLLKQRPSRAGRLQAELAASGRAARPLPALQQPSA
jgi:hypothetical protein